jgi:DNA-binding NarL/FixJ family response regulator
MNNISKPVQILHEAESWHAGTGGGTPSSRVKVFLVEDHLQFRRQLAHMITRDPRFIICGESDNANEAVFKIGEEDPDLVIVDITLKGTNGLDLIKDLKARSSRAALLVLSMHDESMYAERALRAGADGYITKSRTSSELRGAIDRVLEGGIYLSPRMTSELLHKMAAGDEEPEHQAGGIGSLSPRERDIFHLIGKGLTTRDIAHELQLGEKTVHSHRYQIKAKLGVKHNGELYTLAAQWVEDQANSEQVKIAAGENIDQDGSVHG